MTPFVIRKCDDCGNWHLWMMINLGPMIFPTQILTTTTFDDMLIALNETDLSDLYA